MIKSKNLLIKQGSVYGVKSQSKTIAVGVPSSAVMNLKNTHNKRREIVQNAKLNNFDPHTRVSIQVGAITAPTGTVNAKLSIGIFGVTSGTPIGYVDDVIIQVV